MLSAIVTVFHEIFTEYSHIWFECGIIMEYFVT